MKIHEDFLVELSSPLRFIYTIGWWIEHRLHCKVVWVTNVSLSRISVYLYWLINIYRYIYRYFYTSVVDNISFRCVIELTL